MGYPIVLNMNNRGLIHQPRLKFPEDGYLQPRSQGINGPGATKTWGQGWVICWLNKEESLQKRAAPQAYKNPKYLKSLLLSYLQNKILNSYQNMFSYQLLVYIQFDSHMYTFLVCSYKFHAGYHRVFVPYTRWYLYQWKMKTTYVTAG